MKRVIEKTQAYVERLFRDQLSKKMFFHDVNNTLQVVRVARDIGSHSGLNEIELFKLELSAWFHDTGYTQKYTGHEEQSMHIAADFLHNEHLGQEFIDEVCRCINDTRFPQSPSGRLGSILCDADLYHFSLRDYVLYSENLRKEWEVMLNLFYDTAQWKSLNLQLLISHEYFEPYSRSIFQPGKQLNVEKLSGR